MKPVLRYLRITWTVFCAIACVLLIVLWVRSQHTWDNINGPLFGKMLVMTSRNGGIAFALPGRSPSKWYFRHAEAATRITEGYSYALGFGVNGALPAVFMPHWFTVLLLSMLGVAPWIRRFSVRTLLIATTLVAAVLGLIVWFSR